jgi:hypothetical protein
MQQTVRRFRHCRPRRPLQNHRVFWKETQTATLLMGMKDDRERQEKLLLKNVIKGKPKRDESEERREKSIKLEPDGRCPLVVEKTRRRETRDG